MDKSHPLLSFSNPIASRTFHIWTSRKCQHILKGCPLTKFTKDSDDEGEGGEAGIGLVGAENRVEVGVGEVDMREGEPGGSEGGSELGVREGQ